MRLFELVAGLAILLAVAGFIRFQYTKVATQVTSEDQSQYQLIPAATPVYRQICRDGTSKCLVPTVQPIFQDPKQPSRGLSLP